MVLCARPGQRPPFNTLNHPAIEPRPALQAACLGLPLVLGGSDACCDRRGVLRRRDGSCVGVDVKSFMTYPRARRLAMARAIAHQCDVAHVCNASGQAANKPSVIRR